MPTQHDIQIQRLDKKITALSDALARLGAGTDLKELLRIIRNPGYTTPAELAFSHALVDSVTGQVQGLATTLTALVKGSKQVGTH